MNSKLNGTVMTLFCLKSLSRCSLADKALKAHCAVLMFMKMQSKNKTSCCASGSASSMRKVRRFSPDWSISSLYGCGEQKSILKHNLYMDELQTHSVPLLSKEQESLADRQCYRSTTDSCLHLEGVQQFNDGYSHQDKSQVTPS